MPALDYSKQQRTIKTGRGSVHQEDSLSGFYSATRNILSRDRIEVNKHDAVADIIGPN